METLQIVVKYLGSAFIIIVAIYAISKVVGYGVTKGVLKAKESNKED